MFLTLFTNNHSGPFLEPIQFTFHFHKTIFHIIFLCLLSSHPINVQSLDDILLFFAMYLMTLSVTVYI